MSGDYSTVQHVVAALASVDYQIPPSTILDALSTALAQHRSVVEVLIERQCLSADRRPSLESRVDELMSRHAGGLSEILSELRVPPSLRASLTATATAPRATLPTSSPAASPPPDDDPIKQESGDGDINATLAMNATVSLKPSDGTPIESSVDEVAHDQTVVGTATLASHPAGDASVGPTHDLNRSLDPRTPRFTKISFLARGNLGEVFVAEDRELNRRVALKEISPRSADQRESRRRFLVEGEVTGRLEHPGIVPVYGMGFGDDGRPYYAMRLIEGRSLNEVLKDFHQNRSERTRLAGTLAVEFRQLLSRLIQVCEAIQFAHSRGILHRDIKPSNIMVGPFGETLVVDWGLAKSLGGGTRSESLDPLGDAPPSESPMAEVDAINTLPESPRTHADASHTSPGSQATLDSEPSANEPVIPGLSPAAETIAGAMVGTPAYMSPEQASGDTDSIGPAADIYALGATLYHILTGSPPVSGRDLTTVLLQVRSGRIDPPRKSWRAIPRQLQAICLKALAKDPGQRHGSARELAEDLQRYMADEPVSCHRGSVLERCARWARHHQRLSASLGAASLALVATLTVAFGVVSATNQRLLLSEAAERSAKDAAAMALVSEKDSSDRAIEEAHKARIAQQEALEAQERAQDAERIALENAEAERAAKQEALAQQSRAEQTAEFLVGIFQAADSLGLNGVPFFIPRNTGEQLTVNDLLSRGKERIEQDLVQDPAIRASILNSIGNAFRFSGELEQAQEALEESLRIRRELVPPNEADIAKSAHNLAFTLHELGLYDQAEELYREALEIQRRLDGGESPETASIEFNLAWLIGQAGNPEESAELMRHVIEVRKEQGDPRLLSIAQIGLAIALLETGDKAGAALPLTAAQLRLNSLEGNSLLSSAVFEFAWGYIDPFGGQAHFQKALENVKATLGDQHIYTGFAHYLIAEKLAENDKFDEALVHMEQAWEIAESQTRLRHPRIVFLANLYGYVLTQLDRRSEAHVRWQTFLEAQEAAFGIESPRCAEAWYEYALFCNSRTEATTRRDAFKIAVDGFASVPVEEIPPSLLRSYEDASYRLALLLVNQGSREDAEEWFARCESLRPLVASSTDHDGLYARAERVSNLSRLGRHDDAIRLAEEYHDHLSHLDVTGEKARDLREHYYRTEVVCYANAQRWSDSLARFEDYRQHVEPDADGWFRFSQLAASAGKFCLTSNESEQALSFRSLAIEGLQKAVDLGWRDWDSLRGNSNFEPWLEDQVFLDAFPRLRNDTSSETRIRDLATETPAGDN